MNPIPLSAPDGRVYAYACGVCHHAHASEERFVRMDGPDDELVQASRAQAERCCGCRQCQEPLPKERMGSCASCAKKEIEIDERYRARLQREATQREASLVHALDRDAAERLRDLMSDLSESHMYAGWLVGLEYVLWAALFVDDERKRYFGLTPITDENVRELRRLHTKAGGWWRCTPAPDYVEVFVPTAAWLDLYTSRGDVLEREGMELTEQSDEDVEECDGSADEE